MLQKLYSWYGKRTVIIGLLILVALVGTGITFKVLSGKKAEVTKTEEQLSVVTLAKAGDLESGSSVSTVGTVEAISEAQLQTEASGRITAVNVGIGDKVSSGAIIASIENSRERASLLQAQGAYESALAGSLQSGVGLTEASIGVENTYRNAFTTSDAAVRGLIDELFANPRTTNPGFKLDGGGRAPQLNEKRVAIEQILTSWSANVSSNYSTKEKDELLDEAEENTREISDFAATLSLIISEEDPNSEFTADSLAAYKSRFASTRAALDGSLAAISGARQAYEQAKLSANSSTVSQSGAGLKSALGSLRAAEANYEKTIVRSPISGVVNALYLKTGEFVGMSQPAAIIANNGSLQIRTAIAEEDRNTLSIGGSVRIEDSATGTIARIAPAIDPTTGKVEVIISVASITTIKNGDTVRIAFPRSSDLTSVTKDILVPLASLKITPTGPIAFTVDSESKLVATPVTLGAIQGDMVLVTEGLNKDIEIVTDARGLKAGQKVSVTK